jgi:hypothetical protein
MFQKSSLCISFHRLELTVLTVDCPKNHNAICAHFTRYFPKIKTKTTQQTTSKYFDIAEKEQILTIFDELL